MRTVPHFIAQA